jgi:murein DD-endopeptidase MepM/ murein hydrolase activator NlpD
VIAALLAGCCVGALADWQLREKGPPRPAYAVEPVVSAVRVAPPEPAPLPRVEAAGETRPVETPRVASIHADTPSPERPPVAELASRRLRFPIDGMDLDPLKGGFDERRAGGTRAHEAVDILAPRHTPIHAVEDGTIAKLFFSKAGGRTVYQFDPSGRFCYYYAHLERYAEGLREGLAVSRSEVIGYVGTSGNAPPDTPHLHFTIFELTPARHWWQGTPVDPYLVLRETAR